MFNRSENANSDEYDNLFFDKLPKDIYQKIFSLIDYNTMTQLKLVNKFNKSNIHTLLSQPSTFLKICKRLPTQTACGFTKWYQTTPAWNQLKEKLANSDPAHVSK